MHSATTSDLFNALFIEVEKKAIALTLNIN
jgi:hypothetical protein